MSPDNSGIPGTTPDNSFTTAGITPIGKGAKVSWRLRSGENGTGTVVTDEAGGLVQVIVETQSNPNNTEHQTPELFYHSLWCNVAILTVHTPIEAAT